MFECQSAPWMAARRLLMLALALLCASCAAPSGSRAPEYSQLAASADGAILAQSACAIDTSPAALEAAVDKYFRADMLKAGLQAELAATPLSTIFTQADNVRLADAAAQGRCQHVMYRSSGLRVAAYLFRPPSPGPHPVIVWLRGGNRAFGKVEQLTLLNLQALADAGFVVLAPQYRGVDGGEGADEFGGADVGDVLALTPLARSLPFADASRLYLLGGSRGAMEGAMALRAGMPVRAAAFRGGLYNLKTALAARPELEPGWKEMMPDLARDREAALTRRSALAWAHELRVPILLLHGRQDWRSALSEAQAFDAALASAKVPHKLVIYERDEHQLALHRRQWMTEVVDWFRAHGAFAPAADRPNRP